MGALILLTLWNIFLGTLEIEGKSVFPEIGTTIFLRLNEFSKVKLLSKLPEVLLKNLTYNLRVD